MQCATDRVYNKSPSTVWHFIFLPCKSNEALIDSLHWFNLASPGWNTALLSDGELGYMCVCVCVCVSVCACVCSGRGYTVFVAWRWVVPGSACDGLATPLDDRTVGNQHLSSASIHTFSAASMLSAGSNGAYSSCPRCLRLYHPLWDNNSTPATSDALIEIRYFIELVLLLARGWMSLGCVIRFGN